MMRLGSEVIVRNLVNKGEIGSGFLDISGGGAVCILDNQSVLVVRVLRDAGGFECFRVKQYIVTAERQEYHRPIGYHSIDVKSGEGAHDALQSS